uniref:GIY endonuclease n=1 Tax=Purpureocillium takamizusanense TaxID=2060973 RepID=UPI001FA7F4AD|nr:GIY endonuclease [Purpureocillium takamizusanense]UNI92570.1 GIY endonuclease [Purpureocillium takamizusanense]
MIKPIYTYTNPYLNRREIYKNLNNKCGIYLWTNIISDKKYIGSSVNLSRRLKDYFNKSYLQLELKKNNSIIYKALLKYNYINFKLDILEFCNAESILEREQFYLNNLELKYNTLKVAGSLLGFKHSELSKERIRMANLGRSVSEETRMKLYANTQAFAVRVENINTKEIMHFPSIRRAGNYTNINYSYIAQCLAQKGFYQGKGFYIVRTT